jgi:hypothetical protein
LEGGENPIEKKNKKTPKRKAIKKKEKNLRR